MIPKKNYLVFFLIFVISIDLVQVFGQTNLPIIVTTDELSYVDGDTILVSGEVRDILFGMAVSLRIFAPNGDLVTLAQLDVDAYNKFGTELAAGGTLWGSSGTYTIKVVYGTEARTAEARFDFGDSSEIITIPSVEIPEWIKDNARWWSEDQIGDSDFTNGIQFMMKEDIISIPDLPQQSSET